MNRIEQEPGEDGTARYRIWVTAPADRGAANAAALVLLAGALGCPKSELSVLRGHRSRQKMIGWTRR